MQNASLIQSLRTYDQLADLYGAQIGGQMRTGSKQTMPHIGGNGDATPSTAESSVKLNTSLDMTQGPILKSSDANHMAIQGTGFFLVTATTNLDALGQVNAGSEFFATRDGEFHTDEQGRLVNANGLALVTPGAAADLSGGSAVYDDGATTVPAGAQRQSTFANNPSGTSLVRAGLPQNLEFSAYGSTVFSTSRSQLRMGSSIDNAMVFSGALEGSNSSATQSVAMLGQSQKLFAASTTVFKTNDKNTDAFLGIIR